ncbi:MAG TPA: hypothetical protein VKU87_12440, partial [Thermomicrobiaceae bacterium]|nr:hypothetical protein [Thermomicrobiaceae bacterium]
MMLSRVLGIRLDSDGVPRGRLADLVVDLNSGDEPQVSHLVAQFKGSGQQAVPWEVVSQLDLDGGKIVLSTWQEDGDLAKPEHLPEDSVRLRYDVLDAAIIDIPERRSYIANDLWLEKQDGNLRLCSVDTSAWGIVRRMSHGLIDHRPKNGLRPWATVDYLRGVPHGPDESDQHHRLAQLPPGEIALLVENLSYLHAT